MEISEDHVVSRRTRSSSRISQANAKPKETHIVFKKENESNDSADSRDEIMDSEVDEHECLSMVGMFVNVDVQEDIDHNSYFEENGDYKDDIEEAAHSPLETSANEPSVGNFKSKGIIAKLSQKLNLKLNSVYTPRPTDSLLACLEPEVSVVASGTITSGGVYVCPWCPLTSSSPKSLEEHKNLCHRVSAGDANDGGGSPEYRHICDECGKSFAKSWHLKRHYIIHTGERPFICVDCGDGFPTASHLSGHQREHTGERPFRCRHCSQTFTSDILLRFHLRIHGSERPFECSICGERFAKNSSLRIHLRSHIGDKPFMCFNCGEGFASNDDLMMHRRNHTTDEEENYSGHRCKHCGVTFKKKQNFNDHMWMQIVDKHPCHLCSKSFPQIYQMKVHMRNHHKVEPPESKCKNTGVFVCLPCKKEFGHVSPLKRHLRIHSGEKPYKCCDCGESFRGRNDLKVHMRVHTGERPFSCPECGESFTQKGNLTVHIRTHTGERPFECHLCGRCFLKSSNLKEHMKVHQEGRGKRVGMAAGGRPPRFLPQPELLASRGHDRVVADKDVTLADAAVKKVSEMAKDSTIFRAAIAERLKGTGFVSLKKEADYKDATCCLFEETGFKSIKKNENNFGETIAERLKETGVLSFGNGKISLKLINVKGDGETGE